MQLIKMNTKTPPSRAAPPIRHTAIPIRALLIPSGYTISLSDVHANEIQFEAQKKN